MDKYTHAVSNEMQDSTSWDYFGRADFVMTSIVWPSTSRDSDPKLKGIVNNSIYTFLL